MTFQAIDVEDIQEIAWDPLCEPPRKWTGRPPIQVDTFDGVRLDQLDVVAELQRFGYAVLDFGPRQLVVFEELMLDVARRLGLGQPFVPDLYKDRSLYRHSGMHLIGAASNLSDSHDAFTRTKEQALHTDGTLQPLGFIRTTMLGCVESASEGGSSVLFNALGAFWNLLTQDRPAALTLLWDGCLERSASLSPDHPPTRGPAFGLSDDRRLLTRYSRTPGDRYYAPLGKERDLKVALNHLSSLARPGCAFCREIDLMPGQLLVLANSRLSHGRASYRDNVAGPSRLLLRALFRESAGLVRST